MRVLLPAIVLSVTASLAAQEAAEPRFRIGMGFAGGRFDYRTDGSPLDDRTDAAMFRLDFEATSKRGVGGGIRLSSIVSDDDLFADTIFPRSEAADGTMFAHFTYRVMAHRFSMPMRAGLLLNGLTLTEQLTDLEISYTSLGPYFEIAPEVVLVRGGKTQWSLFGEIGFGFGGTQIDIDGDARDYDSFTSYSGLELGTRLQFGPIELGLSYVGRWQWMEESDPEGGFVVLPYDANFQGLMFNFAVIF